MPKLILIRGLPGVGKTTAANPYLDQEYKRFSADDYFMQDGKYMFDGSRIALAHQACYKNTVDALKEGHDVVVDNTFTQRWEMEQYLNIGTKYDIPVEVEVIDLFDGGFSDNQLHHRNVHDVPEKNISMMRKRYEHDWKNSNPIPPWERKK
jgi:predicted kinase